MLLRPIRIIMDFAKEHRSCVWPELVLQPHLSERKLRPPPTGCQLRCRMQQQRLHREATTGSDE